MDPFQFIVAGETSYDAIIDKDRRRPVKSRVRHEDRHVSQNDRRKMAATSRDVQRNFAIARWAVNKHLDYVSSFTFQAKTGRNRLDEQIESLIGGWQSRHRCDVARRHPFRRMVRLAEARKQVDGDIGLLKIAARKGSPLRGKLQAIEGDRIAVPNDLPSDYDKADWLNGVRLGGDGAAQSYCICDRDENDRLVFGRTVPAKNLLLHACYDRFDQVRGISPIVSSLNSWQDTYEGFDYTFARMKVEQMFGLAVYRNGEEPLGDTEDDNTSTNADDAVDFGRGPFQLDLDVEDRAEFLQSNNPSTETVEFLKMMIHVSLKALDIPYSFFDESFTNFYGSRGGLIQYLKSCRHKIADLQELLDDITRWRLGLFVADGDLELPAGFDFSQLRWEWVPDGVPWWDPEKEVRGHTRAIAAGLTDFQRVCHETGTDFYDNIDRISEQQAYAAKKGVVLNLGMTNAAQPAAEDDDESEGSDDDE